MSTMNLTGTAVLTASPPPIDERPTLRRTDTPGSECPQCGLKWPPEDDEAAQERIVELEKQIRDLNEKAVATAEKFADYEEQIHSLRSRSRNDSAYAQSNSTSTAYPATPTSPEPQQSSFPLPQQPQPQPQQSQTRLAAFTSFLPYGRRATNASQNSSTSPASPPRPTTANAAVAPDLQDALNREQALRKAAESRLTQAHSELEDLTAQLFGQANEMVAQERKARAKLEERVEVLERRDGEKRRRLERLEKAIERVDRVRGMVGGM